MPDKQIVSRSDFERVVAALNTRRVEYAIIGAYAVVYHGYVRNTQDLDILIRPAPENARRAVAALHDLGFRGPEIAEESFTVDNGLSLGEEPVKVDLIAYLPGVDQEKIWSRLQHGRFGNETARFLSFEDLVASKRSAGRGRDLDDVRMLEEKRRRREKDS